MANFAFNRIHASNLGFALVLSLIGKVYVRTLLVSRIFQKRFLHLEYQDVDSWNIARESAYLKVKHDVLPKFQERFLKAHDLSLNNDIVKHILQYITKEAEGRILFEMLANQSEKPADRPVLMPDMASWSWFREVGAPSLWGSINLYFEWFYWLIRLGESLLRVIVKLRVFDISNHEGIPQSIRAVVFGISLGEIPAGPDQINFAWWSKFGLCPVDSTLYVLPAAPSESSKKHLDDWGIRCITEKSLYCAIPWRRRVYLVFQFVRLFLHSFFQFRLEKIFQGLVQIEALPWSCILSGTHVKLLMSSLSTSWPEHGIVLAANSAGISTVNWAYAGSSFSWTRNYSQFSDRLLWRSIICSKEVWTWSKEASGVLSQRKLIEQDAGPIWSNMGPMMCGNPSHLLNNAQTVREKYLQNSAGSFFLAVFDVPLYKKHLRMREGYEWGPYTSFAAQSGLFKICKRALLEISDLSILLKVKRASADHFELPDEFFWFVDPKNPFAEAGRLFVLQSTIDPYLPIAMSDACIATPFTSPVMLAAMLKRGAYYYEPTGSVRHTFENVFKKQLISNEDELIQTLKDAVRNRKTVTIPDGAVAIEMLAKLKERLNQHFM